MRRNARDDDSDTASSFEFEALGHQCDDDDDNDDDNEQRWSNDEWTAGDGEEMAGVRPRTDVDVVACASRRCAWGDRVGFGGFGFDARRQPKRKG